MRSVHILVAVAAASGCGNGGDGAGPAPVATVTVAPPHVTLSVGDTVRLVATPLDGSGVVVSGRPVTWSSGATAVVTVSTSGTVTAVTAGSATVTATVDGRSGTAQITSNSPGPKIVLDATGASASVGFGGAIITATASSGLVYQLTIPEGALDVATQITVTPIKSFTGLPLSGGFVGGVDFQPSGLRFHSPATLVIRTAPNIPAGQRLVGLQFSSAGDSLRLEPATLGGGTTTLLISHFSGAGVALGTVLDLSTIPVPPNSAAQDTALASLSGLLLPGDQVAILAALRRWQQAIVLRLQLATTDVLVRDARAEFAAWFAELALYPGTDGATLRSLLSPELATLRLVLAAAYRVGITFANQQCVAQRNLIAARNALILQSSAQTDSVATVGNSLDRPTVLTNLCVRLVLIDSAYVPTPGQPTPLSVRFGFRFGADSTTAFDRFGFLFDIHGTTNDRALRDTTDAVGRYTLSLTPSGAVPNVRVDVNACLVPLTLPEGDVCLALSITRQFGRTIDGDVIANSQAALATLVGVSRINGNLGIGGPITSTDLSELTQLNTVTGRLQIFDAASVRSLTGLANLRVVGSLTLGRLVNVTDFTPLSLLPAVNTLTLTGMPQVTSLAAFGGMSYSGLVITQMPGLTTLSDLKDAPVTVTGPITLTGNAKLFDVSVLRNVATVGGDFSVTGNPLLTTLNDLVGLTQVTGAVVIGGTGLTAAGPVHLAHIGSSLTVNVHELDLLSTFDLPDLLDVGGDLALVDGPTAPASAPLLMRFSALQRIGGNVSGGSSRIFDLSLPSIAVISGGDLSFLGGLRNLAASGFTAMETIEISGDPDLKTLVLGGIQAKNDGWIEIDGNPSLTTLQFTGVIHADGNIELDDNAALTAIQFAGGTAAGYFEIVNNAVLSSVSGAFSSVGNDLQVDKNPNLSTAAAMAWAAQVAVGGVKEFNQDKIP